MNSRILLASLMIFHGSSFVFADAPLAPPKRYTIESSSNKYIAIVDPKDGVTVSAAANKKTLWKSPKAWSRSAFLADDGEHLITSYNGLNLIPLDYKPNLVLITFWHREKKIREITVGDLFPDPKVLTQTVSHYHWGSLQGIIDGKLIVMRCDNKQLKFDITSGKKAH